MLRRLGAAAVAVLVAAGTVAASGTAAAQTESSTGMTLVVANATSLSDVGTAASLVAAGVGDAVVFAASAESLGAGSAAVVDRFEPTRVVVVGGRAALQGAIDDELAMLSADVDVQRLAGDDRIHTAALAAEHSERQLETVVLANGWSLSDVGTAASVVATGGADAVLYAHKDRLGDSTAEALRAAQPQRVLVVGGTAALSAEVEAELAEILAEASIERLGGTTRIETSALSAERALDADAEMLVVAQGWSDAEVGIAASLAAAHGKAAVVYTRDGDQVEPALKKLLQEHRPDRVLFVAAERTLGVTLMRRSQDASRSSTFERITALRPETPAEFAAVAAHYDFVDRAVGPPQGSVNPNPRTAAEYFDKNCKVNSGRAHSAERTRYHYLFCQGDARSVDFSGVNFLAEARARGAKGASGNGQITLSAGDYRNASFVGADLRGVDIAYGDFSWADFSGASFGDNRIGGWRGWGYIPDGIVLFIGTRFEGTNLHTLRLANSCFAEADFSKATFQAGLLDGRFAGARFTEADLSGADLDGPLYNEKASLVLPEARLSGWNPSGPVAAGSGRWEDIAWPLRTGDSDWFTDRAGYEGVSFKERVPEYLRTGRWCEALAGRWPLDGLSRVEEFFAANCELDVYQDWNSYDSDQGRYKVAWPFLRCGGWGLDFSGTDFSGVEFGKEAQRRGGIGPDGKGLLIFTGHTNYSGADFSNASFINVHFLSYFDGDVHHGIASNSYGDAASARTVIRDLFPDNFTGADFRGALFGDKAYISGIFNKADLRGVDLGSSFLGRGPSCFEQTDFSEANLAEAILPERLRDGAKFDDANTVGFNWNEKRRPGWLAEADKNRETKAAVRRWCPGAVS